MSWLLWLATLFVCSSCAAEATLSRTPVVPQQSTPTPTGDRSEWARVGTRTDGQNAGTGVAVFSTALDTARVTRLVQQFFDAIIEEDIARLQTFLTTDAVSIEPRGRHRALRTTWAMRFEQFEYRKVTAAWALWQADLSIADDIASPIPPEMHALPIRPDECVVHVTLEPIEVDGRRLFGDSIWFSLRPEGEGFLISCSYEDFAID
jgi:hypothetical protein